MPECVQVKAKTGFFVTISRRYIYEEFFNFLKLRGYLAINAEEIPIVNRFDFAYV